jgi:catechol 2,3-dioxygenase-like lactoylglutathione lyase family enzyme
MGVGVLDHFNIRTRKLGDTVRFYQDILGLEKGDRPNFAFPGAWMYSEGKAVVHLVDISATGEQQKPDSGVVHHVAFASRGFAGMKQRLQSSGMAFEARQVPGGELWQIFVNDPNGVTIELNYEAANEQDGGTAPAETREDIGKR